MTSHLTLPWRWVECFNSEDCESIVHQNESTDVLNSYPMEWMTALLGNCVATTESFAWTDEDGRFHCEDGPAVMTVTEFSWYLHGVKHRAGGPAYVKPRSSRYMVKQPRKEPFNASEMWFFEGRLHREDGPAITNEDFAYYWYHDGLLHRGNNLPAMVRSDGKREWWTNGRPNPSACTASQKFFIHSEMLLRKLFRLRKRIRIGEYKE